MTQHQDHKSRMAPRAEAPAGLETDGKGNTIPFDQRTEDDKNKVRQMVKHAIHTPDDPEEKNPEGEIQNPAPMPHDQQARRRT